MSKIGPDGHLEECTFFDCPGCSKDNSFAVREAFELREENAKLKAAIVAAEWAANDIDLYLQCPWCGGLELRTSISFEDSDTFGHRSSCIVHIAKGEA